jgi:hypothetical protein
MNDAKRSLRDAAVAAWRSHGEPRHFVDAILEAAKAEAEQLVATALEAKLLETPVPVPPPAAPPPGHGMIGLLRTYAADEGRFDPLTRTLFIDAARTLEQARDFIVAERRITALRVSVLESDLENVRAANDRAMQTWGRSARRVTDLESMLDELLASAVPHPVEHPTMCVAWERGRRVRAGSRCDHSSPACDPCIEHDTIAANST